MRGGKDYLIDFNPFIPLTGHSPRNNMKEVKNWETANKTIQNANKTKVIVIRDLLVKGYTFEEIAKLLGKNSRQTIYQFYRYNCKKYG